MATIHRLKTTHLKTKPKSKDEWLNDGGGLWLHIRPTGTRTWRFRYSADGKRYIVDLGNVETRSLAEARAEAGRYRKLLADGINPVEHAKSERERLRREQESRLTLATAIERWRATRLINRKDAGAEVMRVLRKDVLSELGDRELKTVNKGDLTACLDRIVARGAKRQANVCLSHLKQFYRWAISRELVEDSPLDSVAKSDVGGAETERERKLSPEEIVLLRNQIEASTLDPRTKLAIWILLSTMARVGELSAARWEHVDFQAGVWHIPESKNGRAHDIFLSDFAARHLKALHELTGHSEWVLPADQSDGHSNRKLITRQISDRQRPNAKSKRTNEPTALALPGGKWTPHDLRRTGATMMGELGVIPQVIERCLNHLEPRKIVRTYQRQELVAERRKAWQMLGERLDEILYGQQRTVINLKLA